MMSDGDCVSGKIIGGKIMKKGFWLLIFGDNLLKVSSFGFRISFGFRGFEFRI